MSRTSEPFLRIPPLTLVMVWVFGGFWVVTAFFWPQGIWQLGFVPKLFGVALLSPFHLPEALMRLIGSGFLHASFLHLAMNTVFWVACGSGIEKTLGARRLITLLIAGIVVGNLSFFAFNPAMTVPLIGASGGISAIFAAALISFGQHNRQQILIWLGLFIGLAVVQSLMGGPNGENVAGLAHVGGFVAGLGLALLWQK